MKNVTLFLALTLTVLLSGGQAAFAKSDRYIGYYYPAPQRIEVYCAHVNALPNVDKKKRVGFIIGIKTGMSKQPYASPYSVFAKGSTSDKLLVVSKQDGYLDTVYRARALLAELSTSARTTPVFTNSSAPEELTFLDLIAMLGFASVTLSDGNGFAHQIHVLPNKSKQCQKADELQ
ncbi:hypothetical protein [Sneathiella sp.]|jgi:hypothetical protein|uniref:hypothetical protein n=1 Tax=Sneathiella sp. TaxID=1964365 RepID=UPI0039E2C1CF